VWPERFQTNQSKKQNPQGPLKASQVKIAYSADVNVRSERISKNTTTPTIYDDGDYSSVNRKKILLLAEVMGCGQGDGV